MVNLDITELGGFTGHHCYCQLLPWIYSYFCRLLPFVAICCLLFEFIAICCHTLSCVVIHCHLLPFFVICCHLAFIAIIAIFAIFCHFLPFAAIECHLLPYLYLIKFFLLLPYISINCFNWCYLLKVYGNNFTAIFTNSFKQVSVSF